MTNIQKVVVELWKLFDEIKVGFWKGNLLFNIFAAFGIALICVVITALFIADVIWDILTSRIFRVLLAYSYFKSQNDYFHWNAHPQSDTELITDGIWILLVMLAFWPENKSTVTITTAGKES